MKYSTIPLTKILVIKREFSAKSARPEGCLDQETDTSRAEHWGPHYLKMTRAALTIIALLREEVTRMTIHLQKSQILTFLETTDIECEYLKLTDGWVVA